MKTTRIGGASREAPRIHAVKRDNRGTMPQKRATMITNEMTNESIAKNASSLVDIAMFEADVWGRKFYRGLVKISRVDDERQDALRRLRSSRSATVRDAANRLVNHDGNYRWFRYLTQAPMLHIELVAQHSCMGGR